MAYRTAARPRPLPTSPYVSPMTAPRRRKNARSSAKRSADIRTLCRTASVNRSIGAVRRAVPGTLPRGAPPPFPTSACAPALRRPGGERLLAQVAVVRALRIGGAALRAGFSRSASRSIPSASALPDGLSWPRADEPQRSRPSHETLPVRGRLVHHPGSLRLRVFHSLPASLPPLGRHAPSGEGSRSGRPPAAIPAGVTGRIRAIRSRRDMPETRGKPPGSGAASMIIRDAVTDRNTGHELPQVGLGDRPVRLLRLEVGLLDEVEQGGDDVAGDRLDRVVVASSRSR